MDTLSKSGAAWRGTSPTNKPKVALVPTICQTEGCGSRHWVLSDGPIGTVDGGALFSQHCKQCKQRGPDLVSQSKAVTPKQASKMTYNNREAMYAAR